MDISTLASDTQTIEIEHPATGEPIGISVEVRSPECDEIKAVRRKWQTRALRNKQPLSAAEEDEMGAETLCAAVASWSWQKGLTFDGKEPDETEAFKKAVLSSKKGAFIANRILEAIQDEAGFFTKSAKT